MATNRLGHLVPGAAPLGADGTGLPSEARVNASFGVASAHSFALGPEVSLEYLEVWADGARDPDILTGEDAGTEAYWRDGQPAQALGTGGDFEYYFPASTIPSTFGVPSSHSRTITRLATAAAIVFGATAALTVFSPYTTVTQAAAEAATHGATAPITQAALEAASQGATARITQAALEVATLRIGEARITAEVVETAGRAAAGGARLTGLAIEALTLEPDAAAARLTAFVVETLTPVQPCTCRGSVPITFGLTGPHTSIPYTFRSTTGIATAWGVASQATRAIPRNYLGSVPITFGARSGETLQPYEPEYAGAVDATFGLASTIGRVRVYRPATAIPAVFGVASARSRAWARTGATAIAFGVAGTSAYVPPGPVTREYAGTTAITFEVYRLRAWPYAGEVPATFEPASGYYPTPRYVLAVVPITFGVESLAYPIPFAVLETQAVAEAATAGDEGRVSQAAVEAASQGSDSTVTAAAAEAATWGDRTTVSQIVLEVPTAYEPDPCAEPIPGESLVGAVGPIVWVEWEPGDGTRLGFAEVDLNDPAAYHEGYKPARLLAVSEVRRAIAGCAFDYEAGRFTVRLADTTRAIRGLLGAAPSRYWTQRFVGVYLITDAGRRAGRAPRLIGYGLVDESPGLDGLEATLRAQDFLAAQLWAGADLPASALPGGIVNVTYEYAGAVGPAFGVQAACAPA